MSAEQMDLGLDIPAASNPPPAVEEEGCGPFECCDLQSVDVEAAAKGIGPLVNEDGVDLWDILRSLKSSGVGRVHFI